LQITPWNFKTRVSHAIVAAAAVEACNVHIIAEGVLEDIAKRVFVRKLSRNGSSRPVSSRASHPVASAHDASEILRSELAVIQIKQSKCRAGSSPNASSAGPVIIIGHRFNDADTFWGL
jgi:hypothetical protein